MIKKHYRIKLTQFQAQQSCCLFHRYFAVVLISWFLFLSVCDQVFLDQLSNLPAPEDCNKIDAKLKVQTLLKEVCTKLHLRYDSIHFINHFRACYLLKDVLYHGNQPSLFKRISLLSCYKVSGKSKYIQIQLCKCQNIGKTKIPLFDFSAKR